MKKNDLKKYLKKYFNYYSFRKKQEEIITNILNKKNTLIFAPTSYGKSLCYQLPALLQDNLTIVISPLIALMNDQVNSLKEKGIKAEYVNSTLSDKEQKNIISKILKKEVKILYLSPEKIFKSKLIEFLISKNIKIDMFAIDEVHCMSDWGYDFRKDYMKVPTLIEKFPNSVIVGLTASADYLTKNDLQKKLNINNKNTFNISVDRPNIFYDIRIRNDETIKEDILKIIKNNYKDKSGIIYCLRKSDVEDISKFLNINGISNEYYHAGVKKDKKNQILKDFISDKNKIIVATVAFGMGINKSNIRFVIHRDLPKNIESFYQESGRAGRDGLKSESILFYNDEDISLLSNFLKSSPNIRIDKKRFNEMIFLLKSKNCIRKVLLNYFNEIKEENCNNCSNCSKGIIEDEINKELFNSLKIFLKFNKNSKIEDIVKYIKNKYHNKYSDIKISLFIKNIEYKNYIKIDESEIVSFNNIK